MVDGEVQVISLAGAAGETGRGDRRHGLGPPQRRQGILAGGGQRQDARRITQAGQQGVGENLLLADLAQDAGRGGGGGQHPHPAGAIGQRRQPDLQADAAHRFDLKGQDLLTGPLRRRSRPPLAPALGVIKQHAGVLSALFPVDGVDPTVVS